MLRVNYVGRSDFRVVQRVDMISRGLSDPGQDLVWSRINGFELDLPNDVAAFLLANDGEFQTDDNLDFGDVVTEAFGGRALGIAELHQTLTTTASGASPFIVPGFQLEVETIGKPIKVDFSALLSNNTASTGTQVVMYEDGVGIHLAFPIAAVTGQSLLTHLSRFTNPPPGIHLYQIGLARYTSGTSTITGASTVPATLSAVEL